MPLRLPPNVAPDSAPLDPVKDADEILRRQRGETGLRLPANVVEDADVTPSFTEKATAVGQQAVRGVAEALPVVGAAIGAVGGAVVGAPTGPGAVATGAAGLMLGAGAGMAAQRALLNFADIPTVEELPPELRPFGFAGQALGGGVAFAAVPFSAAVTGFRTGGFVRSAFGKEYNLRLFDRAADLALRSPKLTAAGEMSAAAAAGAGEGLAEATAPGNTGARVGAGLAASVLAPSGLAAGAVDSAAAAIRSVRSLLTVAGRENAAARELARLSFDVGEDPADVAKQLAQAEIALRGTGLEGKLTPAQMTGNPVLLAIEGDLRRRNARFGRESAKKAGEALEILRRSANVITASGDPEALKHAAALRQQYFENLVSVYAREAEEGAIAAAEAMRPRGLSSPSDLTALSKRVATIAEEALKGARAIERKLYEAVPNAPASADNFIAMTTKILDDTETPELKLTVLPDLVQRVSGRLIEARLANPTPSSIKELRELRTEMLEQAGKAATAGDRNQARILGDLADALLADLSAAAGPELADARAYSKALNDVFTRTFVGAAAQQTKTGAPRVAPELLLRRATASGNEAAALRIRELQEAVQFGTPEATESATELLNIQEQFLRNMAENLIDPVTNRIGERRLAGFKKKYGEVLESFPGLSDDLSNVATAERTVGQRLAKIKSAERVESARKAFQRVAQSDNPTLTVSQILAGKAPQQDFRRLAVVARRDSPEAVQGLRTAVLDSAFQRAGGNTPEFSFEKFQRILFDEPRPGQPSAVALMSRNGVIDANTTAGLRQIISQADKIQTAMRTGRELDDLLTDPNAAFDLVLRIVGAKAGTALAQSEGRGDSLIAAASGSRFARTVFERLPQGKEMDILLRAAQDPDLMRSLLTRTKAPQEQLRLGLKLNGAVFSETLRGTNELLDSQLEGIQ